MPFQEAVDARLLLLGELSRGATSWPRQSAFLMAAKFGAASCFLVSFGAGSSRELPRSFAIRALK